MYHLTLKRLFTLGIAFGLGGTLVLTSKTSFAQIAASVLTGTVTDTSGAVVPNVQVTATEISTALSRKVETSSSGVYYIPGLPPGVYNITAETNGFKTALFSKISLYVGQTATVDIHLEVGEVKQEVTVTGEAPLLTTTNGQLGTVVTGTLVSDLPLNGRNVMQLNLISPGAIHDKNGSTGDAVTINPAATSFSVNGQKGDYNMYLIDGIEIKDWQHGTAFFSPSIDAVQEFQNTTSNYSAAFGAEAAAQVNLLIKSGTNKLHGGAWEFLRNDDLDARDFFQVGVVPPFKRNQFGANLGGPIDFPRIYNGKDKTFFFFNYEGWRQVKQVPETGYLPTAGQLAGDLSTLATADNPVINPFTGEAFTGNVIPPNMIRPSTLEGFLQSGIGTGPWVPAPNVNLPGVNYIRDSGLNYFQNMYIGRVDQKISEKSNVYAHVAFDKELRDDPNLDPNWFVTENISSYSIAGHYTHVFSPTLLFDAGAGLNHFYQTLVQSTAFKDDITNKILQIQGNATIPASWGAPVWSVGGYSNLGEVHYGPRSWWINAFDFRPIFTWSKGTHTLKWGLDLQRVNEAFPEIFRTNGIWSYNGEFSNYPLGDFLLGLPNNINASPDGFDGDVYNTNFAPYFQDDWKVTKRLTVNVGLRYEHQGIPLSHDCRSIGNIYFPASNGVPEFVIADDACPIKFQGVQQSFYTGAPFVLASTVGVPEAMVFSDGRALAPRLGFAYRVRSNTVLRGGAGIFYTKDTQDKFIEPVVNPPFADSVIVNLDSSNFQTFNPSIPYANTGGSEAAFGGNELHDHTARMEEVNLTLEHTVWNTLFSIGYVGSIADHLSDHEDPNQAVPGPGSIASRSRWPEDGVMALFGDNGIANYSALQIKAQHNTSKGLALLASYTWSKAMDNTGGTYVGEADRGTVQNYQDTHAEYGLAGQDIRQRFVVSYVYEMPFGRGKRFLNRGGVSDLALGGWELNGITTASSGPAFSAFQIVNSANTDDGQARPDQIGNPSLSHSRSRGQQVAEFFNLAAFQEVPATAYRFGDAGRHTIIGPGDYEYDFSLFKNFRIKESAQLQFRAEFFNLMNRAIFNDPNQTIDAPGAGALTSTSSDPREIQFALKLSF